MIETALDLIPEEFRDRFVVFLEEPMVEDASLERQLKQYIEAVRMIAPMVVAFDVEQMEKLAEVGLKLLADTGGDQNKRKLAQAAVRYLVEEEDDDEITGVLGLDDDLFIINAVVQAFGRDEWIVPKNSRSGRY